MSSKTYREGVPETEGVGSGEQSKEQVWTVYYTVRTEVHAETYFKAVEAAEMKIGIDRSNLRVEMGNIKAVEAAEKKIGIDRTNLRVEMGNIKGENVCGLCKHIHVNTVCDCGCPLIPLKP